MEARTWNRRFPISCFILCLVLPCLASAQLSLALSSGRASAGGAVTLDVTLDASSSVGPAGLQWTLNVPPQIVSTSAVIGPAAAAAGKSLTCSQSACLIGGINQNVISNGVIASMTLTLAAWAADNLAVQLSGAVAATLDGRGVPIATTDGVVSVAPIGSTSIFLDPSSITLTPSQTQQFTASLTGMADTRVSWSLSPVVGTISSSGFYTAPPAIASLQTVTVTVTSLADSTVKAISAITLAPATVSVALNPSSAALSASQTQPFTATVTGSTNTTVTWSISPAVGAISSSGVYTAPPAIAASSRVTVTATSVADPSQTASAVISLQATAGISPSSATLTAGHSQQFTAPGAVGWSITPNLGQVTATGQYFAPATLSSSQTITVIAALSNGGTATATVFLVPPPPTVPVSVTLSPASLTMVASQVQTFTPTLTGTDNMALIWSISPMLGSISSLGVYTAPAAITSAASVTVTAKSVADPSKTGSAVINLQPAPGTPQGAAWWLPIRVNAGGGAYTDPQGNVWSADTGFSGGYSFSTTSAIAGAVQPAVYQSEHYSPGPFQYQFAVPNGNYTVNLKFAEIFFSSGGRRIFNVALNGQTVLPNFDPAQVGGAFTAVDKQFSVSVSDGQIVIQLTPVVDLPAISGIEILPQSAPQAVVNPIRVNAGGGVYIDPQGNVWLPDTGFDTGSSYSDPRPIAGTSTPALYQKERYSTGPFQYQFSVPNGAYAINLKFAEIYFNSGGHRIFNVALNGQTVLSKFDPAAAGGAFTAVDRQFSIAVTNGRIVIQLTPVADLPTISAIEILPLPTIRVNAGGGAYTDSQGNVWSADTGFNTGSSYSDPRPISGTPAPVLYQSEHYSRGPFQYQFNVPNGTYAVNLKFAEIYFTSGGHRIFDVALNGQTVLPKFDPAAVGGAFTAVDRRFPVTVTNGQIVIQLTAVADLPTISAIEIVPQTFTPIRVNAGGAAYTDPQGNLWSADTGFNTGSSYSDPRPVTGTSTPALYQKEHYATGPFQYQAGVPNGTYTVNLKFAEIYYTSGGNRIFNVSINGRTALPNFDPAQVGGAFTAVDRQFTVDVANGQIAIQLTPVADLPTISAIEIF